MPFIPFPFENLLNQVKRWLKRNVLIGYCTTCLMCAPKQYIDYIYHAELHVTANSMITRLTILLIFVPALIFGQKVKYEGSRKDSIDCFEYRFEVFDKKSKTTMPGTFIKFYDSNLIVIDSGFCDTNGIFVMKFDEDFKPFLVTASYIGFKEVRVNTGNNYNNLNYYKILMKPIKVSFKMPIEH